MSMKGSVMQLMRMASCMGRKSAVTGTAEERGAHGAHAGQKSAQAPGHGRSDLHPVG